MKLNLQIRFYTIDYSWLCLRYAIQEANKGKNVETEIDNYSSEYYLGTTYCLLCDKEPVDNEPD